MAIQIQWTDPTDTSAVSAAYARVGVITLDDINKVATIQVMVFRSAEARNANKNPLSAMTFSIGPTSQPAREATTLPNGTVVNPASPAIPSYDEVEVMFNATESESPRNAIKAVMYDLLKQLPEFSGGVDV